MYMKSIINKLDMSFAGSFSYMNEKIYSIDMKDNITLQICKQNEEVGIIKFINKDTQELVPIPQNITVVSLVNGTQNPPFNNVFLISWISSYSVLSDGKPYLKIFVQKEQSVHQSIPVILDTEDASE